MKTFILLLISSIQFSVLSADITEVYVKSIPVIQRYETEVDIASASTTTLAGAKSGHLRITGTTGISSFGAATAGTFKQGRFAGILILTHSSNLLLPGAANYTTAANDRWEAFCLSSGTWIVNLWKADGTAIVGGSGGGDFSTSTSSSTNNNLIIFSGTAGKTGKDSKIATDGNGNIRTPGTIETGADAGTAGATAWGDGGGKTYRISPQTMSSSANFQPDTAPTTGIPLHTATTTNVVETHLGSTGTGNVARAADPIFTGSLQLPNGAAPTTDAFGEVAGDNNAWAVSRGALQFFDGTANTYLIGVLASDTPSNGQVPTWNTGGTITFETPSVGGGVGTNTLTTSTTAVAVAGSSEETLATYTIPASTLAVAGDTIHFTVGMKFTNSVNNKRFKVKYGATTIFDSGSLTITSATDINIEGNVIRAGATTQKATVEAETSALATFAASAQSTAPAETLSGTVALVVTGQGGAANDVTFDWWRVSLNPGTSLGSGWITTTVVYVGSTSVSNPSFQSDQFAINTGSNIVIKAAAVVTNLVNSGAVTLTDAATVATDASLGTTFKVTLAGNRTLGNPTNAKDQQTLTWILIQDGTGSRTLALDTKFALGTDITATTLTTTASKRDFLTAKYDSTADKFYVVGFVRGY